ncbi:hypothetical protein FPQ18DRAFT_408116 [Pyronema domesticum]|nr:hypothetical protein FPQ18DRAFT_408116 [Pyronema domesticum]
MQFSTLLILAFSAVAIADKCYYTEIGEVPTKGNKVKGTLGCCQPGLKNCKPPLRGAKSCALRTLTPICCPETFGKIPTDASGCREKNFTSRK